MTAGNQRIVFVIRNACAGVTRRRYGRTRRSTTVRAVEQLAFNKIFADLRARRQSGG